MLPSMAAGEHSFAHRLRDATEAKTRLAEEAFALLSPGETVFLDASSTTYFVARLIAEQALAVRVITNSLPGPAGALWQRTRSRRGRRDRRDASGG